MEILLLVTLVAVAASVLYVAAKFNERTRQTIKPLVDVAVKAHSQPIKTATDDLKQQLEAVVSQIRQSHDETRDRLDRVDRRVSGLSKLPADLETLKRLGESVGGRQDELNRELLQLDQRLTEFGQALGQQLDRLEQADGQLPDLPILAQLDQRLAQFGEALGQQDSMVTQVYNYAKRREARAISSREAQAASSPIMGSLVLAMLEAEDHADRKGWGNPPNLYALTEDALPEMPDSGPGGFVLVEQQPPPDGDLIEALTNVHWPKDVVGCILVTELRNLPSEAKEDAPVDPAMVGQWASTHPDGRPARLAVAVYRDGPYTCGLHIKGEDDVQIRTELAPDLVTALRGTF
jgi:hypothetical protein